MNPMNPNTELIIKLTLLQLELERRLKNEFKRLHESKKAKRSNK